MDFIDQSPKWLKTFYVGLLQASKACLKKIGALDYLDRRAKTNQRYHYVRSLLAIHQLEDMIALDVPWWTYDAIDVIESHIKNHSHPLRVFEYGSGASTVWLAKRCGTVRSLEHDAGWFTHLQQMLQPYQNVELHLKTPIPGIDEAQYQSPKAKHVSFRDYVTQIRSWDQVYDLIVIDGRCRSACLQEVMPFLAPGGIIVLDNSDRTRYQHAIQQSGYKVKRFPGWVPGSPVKSETAILSRLSLFSYLL